MPQEVASPQAALVDDFRPRLNGFLRRLYALIKGLARVDLDAMGVVGLKTLIKGRLVGKSALLGQLGGVVVFGFFHRLIEMQPIQPGSVIAFGEVRQIAC